MTAIGAARNPPPQNAGARNPISRAGFEVVAERSIAVFGLVFGAQTVSAALHQLPGMAPRWGLVSVILVFGGLIVVAVASVARRGVKASMAATAFAYLAVVLAWPLTEQHPIFSAGARPWVWYLCTVATAFATVAFPVGWAAAYTVVAPVAYAGVRMLPAGGGVSIELAALDAIYAVILGGTILVIVTMLRQAASAVDAAQSTALAKYAAAVREHAMETERVQVDAIVHDSVLTTLLSAANARSDDEFTMAAGMAKDAMGHLHAAEAATPDDRSPIPVARLVQRMRAASAAFSSAFEFEVSSVTTQTVPVHVAEAMYSAAVQAMVNSMQHAGDSGVTRTLRIRGGRSGTTVEVQVVDDGCGFDPAAVPAERLGLRVSIDERITNVGGSASIRSRPGEGTDVTLAWPLDAWSGQ